MIIKFTLQGDGRIKQLDIAKSSGYPLLDEAAIFAVKNASPYPSLEFYTESSELEITLPIKYGDLTTLPQEAPAQPPETMPEEPAPAQQAQEPVPAETIQQAAQEPTPSKPEPETAIQQDEQAVEEVQPVQEEQPLPDELDTFIDLAVKNNQPTQIAQEEIELAKIKIREAQRNLFPALKIEGYNTDGEVYRVDYDEREAKVQVDQPIYYGGRLKDTLNQSKVNLEITKRNYDRLKIDVAHKAEVAYYNLVAGRMNLKSQESIRQEANKILDIVKRQFIGDLATRLEMTSAEAWAKNIDFQIDSAKQDIAMAELTFIQVLNISLMPEIARDKLEIRELELGLNECLEAGLKNRPELYLSELLVKFNQYGRRIEESKNRFNIDLTSSYSHYEGAWKTEPMNDADNWYVGFKATKPWEASTFTAYSTQEKRKPRFGETSATKTSTLSAEFKFMDNLQRLSDKKKADIDLQRSLSDLNETIKTINFEIKDAYLNYQKALLQANTAQTEAEFRHNEINVFKARAQVGDVEFSSVMEALISLSRAQTGYTQALANYFISLANLKKAAGYGIKIPL